MNYVTRAQWGARNPRAINGLSRVDTLVFHYSAADADEQSDHKRCAARVKGIQNYHMDTKGWQDIAYNFLICKHGYVFEGRGWSARSAATGNDNNHTLACCFLGDDTKNRDDVTAAGRKAMVELAKVFVRVFPYGRQFKGHRDFMGTECPGDEIHGFVTSEAFRKLVLDVDIDKVAWPVPTPQWFIDWMVWLGGGRKTPRPAKVPVRIPEWAFDLRKKVLGNG